MPRDDSAITKHDVDDVAVGPGAPAFRWDARRDRAAYLIAEDEITNAEIAADVGVSRNTLHTWCRRPEFTARVAEHIEALAKGVVGVGIARRRNRVMRLQRMLDRMEMVVEARAADAETAEEASGLVVSKPIYGPFGEMLREYKFDAALVREYRATMEQAAKELGQLSDKIEVTTETLTRRYEGVNVEAV